MLTKNGYLEIEEVMDIPGFPGLDILNQKKCVVVECKQNIPCNPCENACPHNAIVVGNPAATVITSSPRRIARSFNRGEVKVKKASRFADEPELTK